MTSAHAKQDLSKVDGDSELGHSRIQHVLRRQPRRRERIVNLVVTQDRSNVLQIVEIDLQLGACTTDSQELGHSQIELNDAVTIQRTRFDQIDRDVRDAPGWRSAE